MNIWTSFDYASHHQLCDSTNLLLTKLKRSSISHLCIFSKWFKRSKQLDKHRVHKNGEDVYVSFGNPFDNLLVLEVYKFWQFACFAFFLSGNSYCVYYSKLAADLQSKSWSLASLTPLSHKVQIPTIHSHVHVQFCLHAMWTKFNENSFPFL